MPYISGFANAYQIVPMGHIISCMIGVQHLASWVPGNPLVVCCSAAQVANASGVLFSPLPGQDVEQMSCEGAECDLPLSIWASMVPRSAAIAIAEVRWAVPALLLFSLLDKSAWWPA